MSPNIAKQKNEVYNSHIKKCFCSLPEPREFRQEVLNRCKT